MHVFQNGAINALANRSKDFAYYVIDVNVLYDQDIDRVVEVLRAGGARVRRGSRVPRLHPCAARSLGVDAFLDTKVTIKTRIKTAPLKQWDVGRELRRRMMIALEQNKIAAQAHPGAALHRERRVRPEELTVRCECRQHATARRPPRDRFAAAVRHAEPVRDGRRHPSRRGALAHALGRRPTPRGSAPRSTATRALCRPRCRCAGSRRAGRGRGRGPRCTASARRGRAGSARATMPIARVRLPGPRQRSCRRDRVGARRGDGAISSSPSSGSSARSSTAAGEPAASVTTFTR